MFLAVILPMCFTHLASGFKFEFIILLILIVIFCQHFDELIIY